MQKISVVLPVKNGEKYIAQSIESVLNQTFDDFELLIFNDNSTDRTLEILKGYKDSRIKIFSDSTTGLIANLNRGIDLSTGLYIARMDADDIMDPRRLDIQLQIMENKSVDICGTWAIFFGEGTEAYIKSGFTGLINDPLPWLIYHNFLIHPTVMLRREFLLKNNLKYEDYPHAEDYKLWVEIAKKKGVFYVEPTPLLFYRTSNDQVSNTHSEQMMQQSWAIQIEIVDYLLQE